jgi:hypothetical protein
MPATAATDSVAVRQSNRLVSSNGSDNGARAAAIVELIDHALHDERFRVSLSHDPMRAAEELGIHLSASERAGIRILIPS